MTVRDPALTFTALWVLLTATVITSVTQPNLTSTGGVASVALAILLMEAQAAGETFGRVSGKVAPPQYRRLRTI